MTFVQGLAIWFIIAVVATPFIGQWLHRRRIRNELLNLLNTSTADWAVKHREFMARRRSGQDVKLTRDALIEAVAQEELQREQSEFNARHVTPAQRQKAVELGFIPEEDEYRPFLCDENEQPHSDPPRTAA